MFKLFRCTLCFTRFTLLRAILLSVLAAVSLPGVADDFLDPEVAFKFSAKMLDAKTAEVTYQIADGYYMYRERFKFRAEGAKLGAPVYPKGDVHFDETFQKEVETYHHAVTVHLPVDASGPFTLVSVGQGCAEKGLCYPPQETQIKLTPPAAAVQKTSVDAAANTHGGDGGTPAAAASTVAASAPAPTQAANASSQAAPEASVTPAPVAVPLASASEAAPAVDETSNVFVAALKSGKLTVILPLFFLAGLGLSLTPCVLPMVPILSSIIVGEGANVTRARGLVLSVMYSLGMAIFYTGIGVIAGLLGEGLAASFQNPWVLSGFALLIAVLSLSMFDVYQLQMPSFIQQKMVDASGKQSAGKLAGVFVMGALSGLIVGPCVAAPLIGALVVISQSHDAVLGGGALFTMAGGMSVPLILVGISAGWLLPRAGIWMEAVKYFFGVLLLGVAIWMISPVIPVRVQMLAWAALGVAYGSYLLFSKRWGRISRAFGVLFALFGLVQLTGAATNAPDVFQPLAAVTGKAEAKTQFVRVKSVAELDAVLAQNPGKNAMLDFYADWCVSCKEMEKLTFTDPQIKAKFAGMILLQADVTANSEDDKALLKRFHLFGPPGIIFFDKNGREIGGARVIGFQNAGKFGQSLNQAKQM
ncbi:MAG: protein-disulfide reductase DsbD [Burkholderiaceae bacterium]|nr:protein-disulfide reductase DsbD [Burkholderiaceae bacterium]